MRGMGDINFFCTGSDLRVVRYSLSGPFNPAPFPHTVNIKGP